MKKVNFTLTEPLIDKLAEIKKETGMTASEIVRRALDAYIEKRKVGEYEISTTEGGIRLQP